jgi:hypothetical protein
MTTCTKILAVIYISSVFGSQSAIADCTYDGFCGNDVSNSNSSSNVKYKVIASILATTALVGVGVWYLIRDKEDENITHYKATDLSTINKNYKFSLVPISENKSNGLAIQFSYAF